MFWYLLVGAVGVALGVLVDILYCKKNICGVLFVDDDKSMYLNLSSDTDFYENERVMFIVRKINTRK